MTMTTAATLKGSVTLVLGFIVYWLGGLDAILICLLAMIVIDYLTGVLKAIYNKRLSSDIGFKGITKKVCILFVVALSFVIEQATQGAFQVREITVVFFIVNEGISVLENATELGLPIPENLKNVLVQLKGKGVKQNDSAKNDDTETT